MTEYLKKLPEEIQDLLHLFSSVASRNNISIYLVGGIVRDLILGAMNLDLDIVVEGEGIKLAEECSRRLQASLIRHSRFGTATLKIKSGLKIDIASSRNEFYPHPGSLPVVTRGSLRDDLRRRDFTINAMAISIAEKDFGRLVDFFAGYSDLMHRRIRILHNLSFIDDPTRILRAIRFEKRYNFKIEAATLSCLKEAVRLKMLTKVHPHRLHDELRLMLKEEEPIRQIKRIDKLAGFKFISPRLHISEVTYRRLFSLKRCIEWMGKNYPERRQLDTWLIYFIGLIETFSPKDIHAVCRKFGFRRGEEKRMLDYKKLRLSFIRELSKAKLRASRVFYLLEPLSYETIILIKAKYKNRHLQKNIEDFFEIYNGMRVLINGEDLRKMGIVPGPYYKKIFTQALEAKLDGIVTSRSEELALIRKLTETR